MVARGSTTRGFCFRPPPSVRLPVSPIACITHSVKTAFDKAPAIAEKRPVNIHQETRGFRCLLNMATVCPENGGIIVRTDLDA